MKGENNMTNTVMFGDKKITYTESFWTGKRTITINGKELEKIDKKTYQYEDTFCTIKGSYLAGAELLFGVQSIELVRKMTTFEAVLCFLPLLFTISGGVVGGACGGAACAFNAVFIRKAEKPAVKVLYSVLSTVVAFICYTIIAVPLTMLISA